jgi:phosphatidylserine decarboxylase
MLYISGRLFSVADHTVNAIPRIFARNERCVCYFETEFGPMALILVGAINVSAIETIWHGLVQSDNKQINQFDYDADAITLKRGEEMGRFNLGSTVIVLTQKDFKFDEKIIAKATVKLGQRLGGF